MYIDKIEQSNDLDHSTAFKGQKPPRPRAACQVSVVMYVNHKTGSTTGKSCFEF